MQGMGATQDNKTIDNIKEEYCLHNPNSPDCRCINRSSNSLYDEAKKNNPFPDGCWYKPCSTSVYLKLQIYFPMKNTVPKKCVK